MVRLLAGRRCAVPSLAQGDAASPGGGQAWSSSGRGATPASRESAAPIRSTSWRWSSTASGSMCGAEATRAGHDAERQRPHCSTVHSAVRLSVSSCPENRSAAGSERAEGADERSRAPRPPERVEPALSGGRLVYGGRNDHHGHLRGCPGLSDNRTTRRRGAPGDRDRPAPPEACAAWHPRLESAPRSRWASAEESPSRSAPAFGGALDHGVDHRSRDGR